MLRNYIPAAFALSLLIAACSTGTGTGPEPDELDPRRGPLGKVDTVGSCVDACDGPAQNGNCWCDELCTFYGDCCTDYVDTCVGGKTCGGFTLEPQTCPDDQYCHWEQEHMCGAADHPGTCQPKPEACILILAPVCGCDGNTHDNECFAAAAGTSVVHDGPCEQPANLCLADDDCESGEHCDHSECHSPPCPPGMACPAVCMGVCAGSEPPPPPPPADSCAGNCGGPSPAGCWCDDLCEHYGDCCSDYEPECVAGDDRTPASGVCVRNSNDECTTDADCTTGGCGGELCFNPAFSSGITTCDCFTPSNVAGCGCVAGKCTWWN